MAVKKTSAKDLAAKAAAALAASKDMDAKRAAVASLIR